MEVEIDDTFKDCFEQLMELPYFEDRLIELLNSFGYKLTTDNLYFFPKDEPAKFAGHQYGIKKL